MNRRAFSHDFRGTLPLLDISPAPPCSQLPIFFTPQTPEAQSGCCGDGHYSESTDHARSTAKHNTHIISLKPLDSSTSTGVLFPVYRCGNRNLKRYVTASSHKKQMLVLGAVFVLNNSIILLSGQRGPLGRPGCLNLRAGEPVLAL